MNILIFSQRFWPENFRINKIAEKLSIKNNVFVATEKPNYPKGIISILNIVEHLGNVFQEEIMNLPPKPLREQNTQEGG